MKMSHTEHTEVTKAFEISLKLADLPHGVQGILIPTQPLPISTMNWSNQEAIKWVAQRSVVFRSILCVICFASSAFAERPDAGIEQQVFLPTSRTAWSYQPPPPKPSTEFIPYTTPFSIVLFPVALERALPPMFMIPVYLENIDRPYEVVGTIVVHEILGVVVGTEADREIAVRSAASTAWLHGADALLLRPLPPWSAGYYMAGTAVRFSWRL